MRLRNDARFTAAHEQFIKAVRLVEQRPDPDYPDAVKDVVGAVEGVANTINDTTGLMLPALMKEQRFSAIHGALRDMIEKLYAYRGDAAGAAHSTVGKQPVGEEEAHLVITAASGIIAYFAAKFPDGSSAAPGGDSH